MVQQNADLILRSAETAPLEGWPCTLFDSGAIYSPPLMSSDAPVTMITLSLRSILLPFRVVFGRFPAGMILLAGFAVVPSY